MELSTEQNGGVDYKEPAFLDVFKLAGMAALVLVIFQMCVINLWLGRADLSILPAQIPKVWLFNVALLLPWLYVYGINVFNRKNMLLCLCIVVIFLPLTIAWIFTISYLMPPISWLINAGIGWQLLFGLIPIIDVVITFVLAWLVVALVSYLSNKRFKPSTYEQKGSNAPQLTQWMFVLLFLAPVTLNIQIHHPDPFSFSGIVIAIIVALLFIAVVIMIVNAFAQGVFPKSIETVEPLQILKCLGLMWMMWFSSFFFAGLLLAFGLPMLRWMHITSGGAVLLSMMSLMVSFWMGKSVRTRIASKKMQWTIGVLGAIFVAICMVAFNDPMQYGMWGRRLFVSFCVMIFALVGSLLWFAFSMQKSIAIVFGNISAEDKCQ